VIVEYEFFKIFFGKVLPKEAEPPMMLHSWGFNIGNMPGYYPCNQIHRFLICRVPNTSIIMFLERYRTQLECKRSVILFPSIFLYWWFNLVLFVFLFLALVTFLFIFVGFAVTGFILSYVWFTTVRLLEQRG
jgi:hypothetical protein